MRTKRAKLSRRVKLSLALTPLTIIVLAVVVVFLSFSNDYDCTSYRGDYPHSRAVHPLVVAHRSGGEFAAELSAKAFTTAMQQGLPIEFDIRKLSDGTIVVSHDKDTGKFLQGHKALVRDLTTRQWLKRCLVQVQGSCDRPLLLSQVLDAPVKTKRLAIEIKDASVPVPELRALMVGAGLVKTSWVLSIRYSEMVQAAADGLHGAYLLLPGKTVDLAQMKADGVSILAVSHHFPLSMIAQAHRQGLKIWVWTVDDTQTAGQWAQAGVDGIITDDPATLTDYFLVGPDECVLN